MTSNEIRQKFLDFFKSKEHQIVPSAPLVVKDDPTLMFTNSGMNQFKDIFLGNQPARSPRVADTQKCLRVSGKHNDLEEVGVDTYHHTMFEMLGNWSFGDYFKKEAIHWAWELLNKEYGIPAEKMYVTVFEGSPEDGLAFDEEAKQLWLEFVPEDRIIPGSKKDNFWEMGETGPCGPCSEIHVDLRSESERGKISGRELVNTGHPEVIEIWNLVFMQFNRLSNGKLEALPARHVDTGMGFERLCMALQGKTSSYDTDIFSDYISHLEKLSTIKYTSADTDTDIAMRVIADHIRAVSFAIADGQLPSSTGAGYVIRRILRRAVRYGYSFLNLREPFFHSLVPLLAAKKGDFFPEIKSQEQLVKQVILEEEQSFLRTLEKGIIRFQDYLSKQPKEVSGTFAFELYDTYGFPIDLTILLARENKLNVDQKAFEDELGKQKERSRAATKTEGGDWELIREGEETEFVGYDQLETDCSILRLREVKSKNKTSWQLVLTQTPFYPEGGGQTGDRGLLVSADEKIEITDTRKENNLIVHFASEKPKNPQAKFTAIVDVEKRRLTERNHSATHLLHAALRTVLGSHVEQKGSLVNEKGLRFDFSHFSKMSQEELARVEEMVNQQIWRDVHRTEDRHISLQEAKDRGAMALFGEKYGEQVRMITFGPEYSVELCGGTHVSSTSAIGIFVIASEGAVASGVRRIEALTSEAAFTFMKEKATKLSAVQEVLKSNDPLKAATSLQNEVEQLRKKQEASDRAILKQEKQEVIEAFNDAEGDLKVVAHKSSLANTELLKDLAFQVRAEIPNSVLIIGSEAGEKAFLGLMISDNLVEEKSWNAGKMIRDLAKEIQGGGGGQPFYATAGGSDKSGVSNALEKGLSLFY